jgi:hypothetical protein
LLPTGAPRLFPSSPWATRQDPEQDSCIELDDKERAHLRKQALDWLRADLALRTKQLENSQPADHIAVQEAMRHRQLDADLASIRDAAVLAQTPAEEQAVFTQLWADVAALLMQAEQKAK